MNRLSINREEGSSRQYSLVIYWFASIARWFDPCGLQNDAFIREDKSAAEASYWSSGQDVTGASGDDSDDGGDIVLMPKHNGGGRRTHHRAWTLWEVTKLVEGVSKYGAGRWSEIKRLAFPSYTQRTSVDLKVTYFTHIHVYIYILGWAWKPTSKSGPCVHLSERKSRDQCGKGTREIKVRHIQGRSAPMEAWIWTDRD